MPAFEQLDWTRFDVWAILAMEGIATVQIDHRGSCHTWLQEHDYNLTTIDFATGISAAVIAMGEVFHWQEQFGYKLSAESRNLNALRDGFAFNLKPGQGHVLELLAADVAYCEDSDWLAGFLDIAHEYSRWQLALGARFFTTLALDRKSLLIGVEYGKLSIPVPYWAPGSFGDPFAMARPQG